MCGKQAVVIWSEKLSGTNGTAPKRGVVERAHVEDAARRFMCLSSFGECKVVEMSAPRLILPESRSIASMLRAKYIADFPARESMAGNL